MRAIQKLIGQLYRPYKFKVQRQELTVLLNALVNSLPDDYLELKQQRQRTNFLALSDWALFPGFKFMMISYPGTTLSDFKKRGQNYRLSGLRIFSTKLNEYVGVHFIIHDNYLAGLRIERSDYQLEEFDLKNMQNEKLEKTAIELPPSEIDLFYEKLDDSLKEKIDSNDIFDIDFNNRTYYVFYDLEDGNYLATDKKLNVYSLIHDARPMAKKLEYSLADILNDIETKKFDKDKHLEDRFKNGA
jgi:hypothetical protein